MRTIFCPQILIFKENTTISINYQINEEIKDKEVRLIADDGSQVGVIPLAEAMRIAEEKELDLVNISPQAKPPVCKIMDYSKYRFDMLKKEKEAKKNQKTNEMKELSLSVFIDDHDLEVKAKQCIKFFNDYEKVKLGIRMKGRQQAHPTLGIQVMERFYDMCKEVSVIDTKPRIEGRNITMILARNKEIKK